MPGGVYDPNLDKEKDDESAPQIASGGTLIGGSQEAPQSQEKGSGRFQNLQDYLSANQGNQFGNQFAGKVAGDIEGSQQKIAQAGQDFGQIASSANKNPGYDQSKVSGALSSPEQAAQNQATMDYFSGLRNASYGGPKSLVETPDIYGKAYAAEKEGEAKGQAAGSEGGRFALLNQYFGRPGYSQGERNLDQYLVSNDQGAQSSLKQAQENAKQLSSQFGNVQSQAADKASQYGKAAEQARGNIQNALGINAKGEYDASKGGALNSQLGQMQANLSAQQAAAPKRYQALYDSLKPGASKVGLDTLQQLGVPFDERLDPSKETWAGNSYLDYLSPTDTPKTVGQTSSPEQLARLKALEQLSGLNPGLVDYDATPYDINKFFNFDLNKYRADNAAAKAKIPAAPTPAPSAPQGAPAGSPTVGADSSTRIDGPRPEDNAPAPAYNPSNIPGPVAEASNITEAVKLSQENPNVAYTVPGYSGSIQDGQQVMPSNSSGNSQIDAINAAQGVTQFPGPNPEAAVVIPQTKEKDKGAVAPKIDQGGIIQRAGRIRSAR